MIELTLLAVALVVTFFTGTYIEKRHYRRVLEREKLTLFLPHVSDSYTAFDPTQNVESVKLICGSCVVSADFFKVWVSNLKSLFGGTLTTFESLLDRARREAVLRMKDSGTGADMIVKTRLETTEISPGVVEIVAYGTAVYLKK
jgi:uncharacterized protein YbjQ (UPF0145 family)